VAEVGPLAGLARVVAAGEGVPERDDLPGRLVVLPALRTCGGCLPCRRGHAALCRRVAPTPIFASHELVAARHAVVLAPPAIGGVIPRRALVPPAAPELLAALADIGLLAYAAVIRASVEPNRAAIVLGDGPLALFIAALVQHRGATAVRVRAADDEASISAALAASDLDPFGIPLIDAAGGPLERTLAFAREGGLVVLARGGAPSSVAGRAIVEAGLAIIGVAGAHPDLLPELVAFVCAGTLDLGPLTRVVDPCAAIDADERVRICRAPRAGTD
jgi:threonine dehydrogenase-like Zn-dependent dehydrogenase